MPSQQPASWRFLVGRGARSWGVKKRYVQQGIVYNRGQKDKERYRVRERREGGVRGQRETHRGRTREE